jgi:hypothetical protein
MCRFSFSDEIGARWVYPYQTGMACGSPVCSALVSDPLGEMRVLSYVMTTLTAPGTGAGPVTLQGSARGPQTHLRQVVRLGSSKAATFGETQRGPRRPKPGHSVFKRRSGAGDEARTRDPYLGKVAP